MGSTWPPASRRPSRSSTSGPRPDSTATHPGEPVRSGYQRGMGILKKAALIVVGKKVYDEAKKPHNQRKIRDAVERIKAKRASSSAPGR